MSPTAQSTASVSMTYSQRCRERIRQAPCSEIRPSTDDGRLERANYLLDSWARNTGGAIESLGFPRQSAEQTANTVSGGADLLSDQDLLSDKAIARLRETQPDHYTALYSWYARNEPLEAIAERMECSPRTVYNRLRAGKFAFLRVRDGLGNA